MLSKPVTHVSAFIKNGGEIGEYLRNFDWENSPMGSIESWSSTFISTLNIVINSEFPMYLFWGKDLLCYYNNSAIPSLGNNVIPIKSLGIQAKEMWPNSSVLLKKLTNQVLLKGESLVFEDQLITILNKGVLEGVYWTFSYSPIYVEDGSIGGILGNCINTTAKVKSTQNLIEINNRYSFAIDAANLATFDFDPLTNTFKSNNRLKDWFGLMKKEPIDFQAALDVIDKKDRIKVSAAVEAAFVYENGGRYDIEYTINNPKFKEKRHVRAIGKAWFNEDKIAYRFNGIIQDITKKKRAENKLIKNERKFRGLAKSLPNLVWMTNTKGKLIFISDSWYNFTGKDISNRKNRDEVIHPKDQKKLTKIWKRSLASGEIFTSEIRLKNKAGKHMWHLVKGVPIYDQDKIINWIGAYTNIHQQKLKEQKKDEFISIATHEMKTPLTSAQGYLELLSYSIDQDDKESLTYTEKATQSIDRLHNFIIDLLDVSKIQNGKLNYNKTPFNINDLVDETIDNSQHVSKQHKIVKISDTTAMVYGDRSRILQVLINLFSNAIKYSPESDKINVYLERAEDRVIISIQDFGVGMSPLHLSKIFERYYRAQEHSIQFQGMGIGLYLSNEIVTRHGGKMWAESEQGVGSTFHFSLPVYQHY